MNKFVCLVVCALVAMTYGPEQASAELPQLVPFVGSICRSTCPAFCSAMNTVCSMVPFAGPACTMARTNCETYCAEACQCIHNCGPNCDAFERNCNNFNIIYVKGVFCPVANKVCDVACVVGCPQQAFANLLLRVANQLTMGVQQFVQMCFSVLSPPEAVEAEEF